MSRLGRYWLFFVIVAVGLALSWGQVGRKTDRVLRDEPVVYLVNEPDCRPLLAPCAALAGDRALVLGPAARGLAVRQTGFTADDIVSAEAIFLSLSGQEIARRPLHMDAAVWESGDIPKSAAMLRIRIRGARETSVADFPL
ncbi:MAG: hypothetical protein LJE59_01470 [Chromatiaceae bacterium]|jgi:hypothetical protein|nr:hypothetical protein [Chromatiaceae bacterium]